MSQPRYPRHELATSPVGDDVVLLDEQERPIGRADRLRVHTDATPLPPGLLHLPVQRPGRGAGDPARALAKSTWPGVWTNSACGHPRPGEGIEAAARRRIREELGLVVGPLIPLLPDFRYRATDASGIVENEVCPVYAGFVADEDPRPDAAEVADWAWVPWESLTAAITATPDVYSPWAARQVPLMMAAMASKTSFGHHQSPDPDAARRDVDSLLEDKLSALAEDWEEFSAGLGVDVLRHDLPGWRGLLIGPIRHRTHGVHDGPAAGGGVRAVGRTVGDYVTLQMLDPACHAFFADGSRLLVRPGHEKMREVIEAESGGRTQGRSTTSSCGCDG